MAQLSFTPQKFVTFAGSVYAIVVDANGLTSIQQYGGPTNVAYDNCVATATLPWLDLGDPTVRKTATSLDYAMTGSWDFYGSMDYAGVVNGSGQLQKINSDSQPSFQVGEVPWTDSGYHVQLQAKTTGNEPAILSSLVFGFVVNEEKG